MRRIVIVITCFFCSMALTFSANAELNLELPNFNLPDLGSDSSNSIAATKEAQQGLRVIRSFRSRGLLIEDPEINLWIRSLGNKLRASAPHAQIPFYFAVSKDLSINAFATLGGVIVVNAGLILRTDSESELAAVMAHEVAHITQRHIQRIIAESGKTSFASKAALVAGAIAATQSPDAGVAILSATLATQAHNQLSFGRSAEAEADRVGLRILASAGFNPQGMPIFLQKLERFGDSKTAEIVEFLQNHPLSVKRVGDTSFRAKQYGAFKGTEDISYLYMREKIRALSKVNTQTPKTVAPKIKNFAKALKLKERGDYGQAIQASKIKSTENISEAVLLAQLYNKQQQPQKVPPLLKSLISVYPGNEALSAPLAQALLSMGQVKQAWEVVDAINTSEQTSLEIFEIKQEIARYLGNNSLAFRAVAERSIRTGRYRAAEVQLKQAIKSRRASISELREIQQMLDGIYDIARKKP